MHKLALFDIDGVLNNAEMFSVRYSEKYNVSLDLLLPFFKNQFKQCLIGELDLKEELMKVLPEWGYKGTLEDLLEFWFAGEINPNNTVIKAVDKIKQSGIKLVGGTNQEKYRTAYLVEHLALDTLFNKVYSSSAIGVKKPNKEFYDYIAKDQGVELNEIIYWDDDLENVEAAKSFGIEAYQYTDDNSFLEQVAKYF
jgi:putative hydrolase of the HAD superfamily